MTAVIDALLQSASDGVVLIRDDTAVVRANRAAARILGVAADELIGQPIAAALITDRTDRWGELFHRAHAGEEVRVGPTNLRRADDLDVHVTILITAVDDAIVGGNGFCVILQDETEVVIAQETLARSEKRIRKIESLARTGSFAIDIGEGVVQWSPGMYDIFGVDPKDFEGTLTAHLKAIHPDDAAAVADLFEQVVRRGRTMETDHRVVAPDGLTTWVSVVVEPAVDWLSEVRGLSGVCQDVTARKDAEDRVRQALLLEKTASDELRQADVLKDEFLSTVSHELRTPLTAIIGFASLAGRQIPAQRESLEPVVRNAREMKRMIEKLLDYTRIEAGQVLHEPRPVLLHSCVQHVIQQYEDLRGTRTLVNAVPADLVLHVDPDAIERILSNLIGNACRYAGDGITVTVGARLSDDEATMTIADTGSGIPAEHVGRLFERFFRVPGTTTTGTGIGLAIVREYVTQHGGTIECDSTVGEGTTFTVRLPQTAVAVTR